MNYTMQEAVQAASVKRARAEAENIRRQVRNARRGLDNQEAMVARKERDLEFARKALEGRTEDFRQVMRVLEEFESDLVELGEVSGVDEKYFEEQLRAARKFLSGRGVKDGKSVMRND